MAFRKYYKRYMEKTRVGWNQGREVGLVRVRGVTGGKCRQL